VGTFASAALATVSLGLPISVAGALQIVLAGFLIVVMPERGFRPARADSRRAGRALASTLRSSVHTLRGRPILLIILAVSAVHGMSTEGFDRLWVLQLLTVTHLPSGLVRAPALVLFRRALRLEPGRAEVD
jgi:hypothetical protein